MSSSWVVTEEQIVGVRAVAADAENLNKVEELAVDISYDSDGRADVDDVGFAHKKLFCLGADGFDDRLGKQLLVVQTRDALVEIDGRWGQKCEPGNPSDRVRRLQGSPGMVEYSSRYKCRQGRVSGKVDKQVMLKDRGPYVVA